MKTAKATAPKTLTGWIEHLESDLFGTGTLGQIRKKLQPIPGVTVRPPAYRHTWSVIDQVNATWPRLWCDLDFWKLVERNSGPDKLQAYVEAKLKLRLPPIQSCVWREAAKNAKRKDHLFSLLSSLSSVIKEPTEMIDDATAASISRLASLDHRSLLLSRIMPDAVDNRHRLRSLKLNDDSLKLLLKAVNKLADDIRWCRSHKDEEPPAISNKSGGAPKTEYMPNLIEKFVQKFHDRPQATNHSVANELKAEFPRPENLEDDTWFRKLRDAATTGKHLAEIRDGVPVKHYVKDGIGRRPRSKGPAA